MRAAYGNQSLEAALNDDERTHVKLSEGPSDAPADPPFIVDGKEVAVKGDLDADIVVD